MMRKITPLFFLFALILLFPLQAPAAVSEDATPSRVTLSATPAKPVAGDTVEIEAHVVSFDLEGEGLRWNLQGDGDNIRRKDERSLTYRARTEPATLSVVLWERAGGKDVASSSLSVTPLSLDIELRLVSVPQTPLQTWNPQTQSVEKTQGLAVETPVSLEALVTPAPKETSRYVWGVQGGAFLVSQDHNRCVVRRETPGETLVTLSVHDSDMDLGEAALSFDVTLSLEDLKRSRALEHGWGLYEEALALQAKGEVSAALSTAERGASALTEAGVDETFVLNKLEGFKAAQAKSKKAQEVGTLAASLWRDGKLEAALEKYKEAAKLHPHPDLTRSVAQLEALFFQDKERQKKALALIATAQEFDKEGDLESALRAYDQSLALYATPTARSERVNLEGRLIAVQQRQALAQNRRATALSFEAQGDLEGALKKMAESREIWAFPDTEADLKRLQKVLDDQRTRRDEAAVLLADALDLEDRGSQGDHDPELLSQSLEKYGRALELWPDESTKRSVRRLQALLDETGDRIKQADLLTREGDLLLREGRLQEAKNRYLHAQELRKDKGLEEKLPALEARILDERKKDDEARQALEQALELERGALFDEALAAAERGASVSPLDELVVLVKRLTNSIAERNRKIARAEELARAAREALEGEDAEKALDLFWESRAIWPTDSVSQDIQALEGRLTEKRDVSQRAETLHNEAVALARAARLEEAWEKIQASLTLNASPKAQEFSAQLRQDLADKAARQTLLAVPLRLHTVPLIPRTGERTFIRIEDGAWTADKNLTFRWQATQNALDAEIVEGGKAYRFYPGDAAPVTVVLTILQKDSNRELASKTFSVTAEPWTIRLTQGTVQEPSRRWDANLKRLTAVDELMTRTDVVFHAEIVPLPDFPVVCLWDADPDTAIVRAEGNEAAVRRIKTGTGKIVVSVKNEGGILLGTAQARLIATFDKVDVLRDIQRSQAWELWTFAGGLWEGGRRKQAIETAERSLALDPFSPEIENGLLRMKVENEKRERAVRLLAESSGLLLEGKLAPAREKAEEAARIHDGGDAEVTLYAIVQAERKRENDRLEAARLCAEAEALLAAGDKERALCQFRNSYILTHNEAVSQDIAKLSREIEADERRRNEALVLREKGGEMTAKQRFSDAIHFYEQSLQLQEDAPLRSYLKVLEEKRAEEEKIKAEAARMKQKGDALMSQKKTSEALSAYKKSLLLWQDEKLAEYVRQQEQALAQKLRKEAEALVKKKKNDEALEKYRQSLTFAHDKTAEAFVKKHEAAAAKERAQSLIREGDVYLKQKKPAEALATYRLALQSAPADPALLEKIRYLETVLHPASDDLSEGALGPGVEGEPYVAESGDRDVQPQADLFIREGNTLFKGKKYQEALEKYEASYALSKNEKLKDFIAQLRNALKGTTLVQEGNALYKEKQYEKALKKYQESLLYHKNPEVERFILEVKGMLQ